MWVSARKISSVQISDTFIGPIPSFQSASFFVLWSEYQVENLPIQYMESDFSFGWTWNEIEYHEIYFDISFYLKITRASTKNET